MRKVAVLFQLQGLDLEIEDKSRRLEEIESQLGETEDLLAARAAVAETQSAIDAVAKRTREHEWEISRLETKLKETSLKLYDGRSRPARELAGLQKESDLLQRNKGKEEDAVLDLMAELEVLQARLAESRRRLVEVEATWRDEQEELARQCQTLRDDLARLDASRKATAGSADPADLPVYENLRRQKGGRAVARVEQSLCGGCRIVMAMQQVQRARTNPGLTFCGSCGRIVYVPR